MNARKPARALQVPLSLLIVRAAAVRRLMAEEGYSMPSALAQASSGLPPQGRSALQAIAYLCARRRALASAAAGRLMAKRPNAVVSSLIETALSLIFERAYSDFTIVDQTVSAMRADRRTARFAGLANAVLRRASKERATLVPALESEDAVRFNAPEWWIERVRTAHPEAADRILSLSAKHPPMTLRVNRRRTTPEAYLERLAEAGLAAQRIGPEAVLLASPKPVQEIPGFAEGLVSVQDAGTQLAAHLLPAKDGDRVLDACSAPGGKTAHLLELHDLRMTALEIDPERAKLVAETLSRLGLSADVRAADAANLRSWWDGEPYDCVLLDAPCTASGIVRRQPDVPWSRRPSDIVSLARRQKRLLDALWPVVRPGGALLFCTCSIFPEEGPKQAEAFLASHPDAEPAPIGARSDGMMILTPAEAASAAADAPEAEFGPQAEPPVHDGFFYALFRKKA